MLVGDFGHSLQRYARGGEFGLPELDAFAAPLVARLHDAGIGAAERAFGVALSFHVKQLTEWDLLVVADYQPALHGLALAHHCELLAQPAGRQTLAAFRKRPVTSGRIELDPTPAGSDAWSDLRAPAIRFLASADPIDPATLPAELAAGVREGQQGAALLLLDGDQANALASGVRAAVDSFIVRYWLEAQQPGEALRVLTLVTAGVSGHEI